VTELLTVLLKSAGIYLALALIASTMTEAIALVLRLRSRMLRSAIHGMLREDDGAPLERDLYRHPLIASLSADLQLPAYLPSSLFAGALADLIFEGDYANATETVKRKTSGQLQTALLALVSKHDGESLIKGKLERWFDTVVRQNASVYRRQALTIIFLVALLLAIGMNLDSVRMFSVSARESTNREILSAFATEYAKAHTNEPVATILGYVHQFSGEVETPFGWASPPKFYGALELLGRILGLFLSAVLITVAAVVLFPLFRGGLPLGLLKR